MGAVMITASMSWADVTTLVFDGTDDFAGLDRQTTTRPTNFVKEVAYQQDGVDFKLEASGNGQGFALVNAGGVNAGIQIAMNTVSTVTLTVPNGHITGATISMSGYSLLTLGVNFNGSELEYSSEESSVYTWEWNDAAGGETLTITWPSYAAARYIHSIKLTYTPDLGGKEACGLSFYPATAEGIVGEPFKSLVLTNPNKLPVTWSSSDVNVATVDDKGKVTLVGGGTTYIIASTEGNDQYAAGNARYELKVTPTATSVAEMYRVASKLNDKVKVIFPMTTYFSYGASVYAVDQNNEACFITDARVDDNKATVFMIGDIIPANWIATNLGVEGFKGLPDAPTEVGPVEYEVVSSVSEADANKVVILKNVTFAEGTPTGFTVKGTIPDGTEYSFQNPFNATVMPAGTYDVTCVVKSELIGSTKYFYLAPITYAEPSVEVVPAFPETFDITVSSSGITVEQFEDQGVYTIQIGGKSETKEFTVTLAVPAGWDGFIGMSEGDSDPSEIEPLKMVTAEDEEEIGWEPTDLLEANNMKKGNVLKYAADGNDYRAMLYLYKGTEAYMRQIQLEINVTEGDTDAVQTIESTDTHVRYFNLQGVEVINPQNGIFVKIVNGKAHKVTVK